MILKEIDFDMPLVNEEQKINNYLIANGIKRGITLKEYYDEMWRDKRIIFRSEAETVCSKVKRMLPKIVTDSTWKLMINCLSNDDYVPQCYIDSICEVSVKFDFDKYNNSTDEEKIYLQLNALEEAVYYAITQGVAQYKPILDICKELKAKPFENSWIWKKKKLQNGYIVNIVMEHTIKYMNIYAEFKNKNGETICKKLLVQDDPSPICYHLNLGDLENCGDNGVILYNKLKTKFYKAEMNISK